MKIFSVLTFVLLSISPVHAFTHSFSFTPLAASHLADVIIAYPGINFSVASKCAITGNPIKWEVEYDEYKLSFVTFTGHNVWIVPPRWIEANVHYINERTVNLDGIPLRVTVSGNRTLYAPQNLGLPEFGVSLSLSTPYTPLGF